MQPNSDEPGSTPNASHFPLPEFPRPGGWKRQTTTKIVKTLISSEFKANIIFTFCLMLLVTFPFMLAYTFDWFAEYDSMDDASGRDIVLENGTFWHNEDNITQIQLNEVLRGDYISFMHTGEITETEYSSTSCEAGRTDDYGYYEEGDCWTIYWTKYILNSSNIFIETEAISKIYFCHLTSCEIRGKVLSFGGTISISILETEVIE